MSAAQPFARVSEPFDALRPLWFGKANPTLGEPCTPPGYGLIAAAVNEQQSACERKAKAKALREAAKKWPKGRGKFKPEDFGLWLEAEAAAVERGGTP